MGTYSPFNFENILPPIFSRQQEDTRTPRAPAVNAKSSCLALLVVILVELDPICTLERNGIGIPPK